jgi:Domain of unknown function (DUF4398)
MCFAGLLASGCASYPTEQLAASRAAIASAAGAGGNEFAPREMNSAQEKFGLSSRWIAARDYEPARWLAEQAQVDAELAEMKAAAVKAENTAAQWQAGTIVRAPK